MKKLNVNPSKILMRAILVIALAFVLAPSSFAQGLPMGGSSTAISNPLGQSSAGMGVMNMRFPFIVGGSFGIGSGAGIGDGRSVGLCNIRPMIGAWMPGLAFLRLGYGFSSYEEKDDDKKDEVETSDFNVDLGVHLFSEFYVMARILE